MSKKAIIIGAGPAGLTAAYELLKRTDIKPIILEKSGDIGGISKTINYKGNRMDIGGHRFFSKSDRVMKWWMNIMPIQQTEDTYTTITYQRKHRTIKQEETHTQTAAPDDKKVMLIRQRLSRIYFLRKFFTYPIQLSLDTLKKLGVIRTTKILLSYLYAQIVPRKPEKSLEDFMINRFGRQLYLLFFKDYTEKVWGVACNEISAEWGAQRIKGISISKAIQHAAKSLVQKKNGAGDIAQKGTETSLIEKFLYPALGPGQLWEEVARQIEVLGGTIMMNQDVKDINISGGKVHSVVTVNSVTGEKVEYEGDYFFSTMPVQELIAGMNGSVPAEVKDVAKGLQYRDFITVGVLLQKLSTTDANSGEEKTLDLKDTWIYIQEKDVKVGRLQLFNNWSPYLVNNPGNVWVGMEYFCNKGDDFWSLSDEEIKRTAISELEKMGLAQVTDVIDSTAHRIEKTYPAYFGTYNQFDKIKDFTDSFENLFLVGRNGMHKYNNSDHSMLTAMVGVDNICEGILSKENIWAINTEQEYHEVKADRSIPKEKTETIFKPALDEKLYRQEPFTEYVVTQFKHKRLGLLTCITLLMIFGIFKCFYPFAGYINDDSYVYLQAAFHNLSINYYPIGYSNFLRFVSIFTKSDVVFVGTQYFLLVATVAYLLLTIFYLFRPGKFVQIFLFSLLVFNPVFLFISNYVSSDSFFITLSLMWFTVLLWIIHKPTFQLILLHGLVLYIAFTVRYNALFFPVLAVIVFLFTRMTWKLKFFGVMLSLCLVGIYIVSTGNKFERLTGYWQFSPFSGWQLANNAMYTYRYIDSTERKPVPEKFRILDNMVRSYFDTSRDVLKHPYEQLKANTIYMWTPRMPLMQYMHKYVPKDSTGSPFRRWASLGPLYNEYGTFIIKSYPETFIKYFVWPNMVKYYAPPVEFLQQYSTGKDSVDVSAQVWFNYSNRKIYTRVKNFDVELFDYYPIINGAINMIFLIGLGCIYLLQPYRQQPKLKMIIRLVALLWVLNFGFSVFASAIALRFQLFQFTVFTVFATLFIDLVSKASRSSDIEEKLTYTPLPIKSNLAG